MALEKQLLKKGKKNYKIIKKEAWIDDYLPVKIKSKAVCLLGAGLCKFFQTLI